MTILILKTQERQEWKSLSEIVPRLTEEWKNYLEEHHLSYFEMDCDQLTGLPKELDLSTVLIPALTPKIANLIRLLRADLLLDFKIILYAHGAASRSFLEFYDWRLESVLETQDQIIVSCEADKILGEASFKNASIKVQPFSFAFKSEDLFNPQDFFFLYHGRINPQKNILSMIQSYELALKENPHLAPMHLVGEEDHTFGPIVLDQAQGYREMLIRFIEQKNLQKNIFFHPYMPPSKLEKDFLRKSHIFLSFSQHMDENFGLAAYKSLTLGMPCLLSGWGGHWQLQNLFPEQVCIVPVDKLKGKLVLPHFQKNQNWPRFSEWIPELLHFKNSDETKLTRNKWGLNVLGLNRTRSHATPFLNTSSQPFKFFFDVYSGVK